MQQEKISYEKDFYSFGGKDCELFQRLREATELIEIDIILGSKYVSPWREEMICTSGAQVLIVAKSVLANRGFVHGINAWSVQLQLDGGGENS